MGLALAVIPHAGSISALTLPEYLFRVSLHLVGVGGLSLLVRWVLGVGSVPRFR